MITKYVGDDCPGGMTEPEDPIAEARRLLAERTPGEWEAEPDKAVWQVWVNDGTFPLIADVAFAADAALIAAAPRLLAALCDRLEANEGETRTAERPDSTS